MSNDIFIIIIICLLLFIAIEIICVRLVPYLGVQFFPILVQVEEEFFATTVRSFFDENGLNKFYICIIVVVITYT